MNPERLQFKGMLRDLEAREKSNKATASGLILLLRNLLNPFEDDCTKLETDQILINADRLKTIVENQRDTAAKIKRIKDSEEIG